MSEQLIDGQAPDVAKMAAELRAMAESLERNTADVFGGCFVVLPPQGGEPIKTLILDSKQDPAQFWSILKTKCDIMLASLDEMARNQQGYGRR